jgi:hypothetical protein
MMFGENANQKEFLFKLLDLSPSDFGRYRDIYTTEDYIVVYTRCGGGNRDEYDDVFMYMEDHPLYAYNEDDDFDCTYASFFFKHPPEYHEMLVEMSKGTITPSEKWQALFTSLDNHKPIP